MLEEKARGRNAHAHFILCRRASTELAYPINALRNVALTSARTDLVFVLDVDVIPCARGFESLAGTPERYRALWQLCVEKHGVLVWPCLELVPEGGGEGGGVVDAGGWRATRALAEGGCEAVRRALRDGVVAPFMDGRYSVGHRATGFDAWAAAGAADGAADGNDAANADGEAFVSGGPSFRRRIQYEEGFGGLGVRL